MSSRILRHSRRSSITNDDSPIDISLQLQSPYFKAGQFVQGTVFANVKSLTPIDKLDLELRGIENTAWEDGELEHLGQHLVYEHRFTVHNFGGSIKEGHYEIPFRIRLPSTLPGSMLCSKFMKIQYELIANFVCSTDVAWQLFYKQYFTVIEPYRGSSAPLQYEVQTEKNSGWLCGRQYETLRVSSPHRKAKGGQTITLYLQTLNKFDKPVHHEYVIGLINCMVGVTPKTRDVRKYHIEILQHNTKHDVLAADGWMVVTLQLPEILCSTAYGSIVANYFYFEIREPKLLSSKVLKRVPINLEANNPTHKMKPKVPLPVDWEPWTCDMCQEKNVETVNWEGSQHFQYVNRPQV